MKIKEGDKPFDFEYRDPKNNEFKLSKLLKHKKIVIYFYPKDFTPGCTTEAEEFTKDYALFEQRGIEIIGISPDSNDSHTKFREKMNIPYMLASDPNNEISKEYGVYGLKKFMGKEYFGLHFVHVLTTGAAASGCLHFHIAFLQFKIQLFCLGHYGHGCR